MNRGTVSLIVATALSAVCPARAYELLRTTNANVHWQIPEITIGLHGTDRSAKLGDESVIKAIGEAAAAWNPLPEMRVQLKSVGRPPADAAAPAVRVVFCKDLWRFQAGLLATTTFAADAASGRVESAVITINECDYHFVGPDEVEPEHMDLQAVIAHEIGHVLGLGHSDDLSAVMFKNTGSVRQRRPKQDDRKGIAAIYAPDLLPKPVPAQPALSAPARDELTGQLPFATEVPWPDLPVPAKPAGASEATKAARAGANTPRTDSNSKDAKPLVTAPNPKDLTPNKDLTPDDSTAARARAPRDMLSVIPLDGGTGDGKAKKRGLMLYTIAPVILPDVEFAPNDDQPPAGKKRRRRNK